MAESLEAQRWSDVRMLTLHGSTHSGPARSSVVSVLLVESSPEEAQRAEHVLRARLPEVRIVHARSVVDARRAVAELFVDLIVTHYELPDGDCGDVLDVAGEAANELPVVAYVRGDDGAVARVRADFPDLFGCTCCERESAHLERVPLKYLRAIAQVRSMAASAPPSRAPEMLRRVRHTISRVNHDLNNPLSIISGNAQLLLELAKALDLDGELVQPIQDIEEASARVGGILRRLADLKDQLPVDEETTGDARAELRELQSMKHGA